MGVVTPAREVEIMRGDLRSAKREFEEGVAEHDQIMLNKSAFNCEQVIEKAIKYYIREADPEIDEGNIFTHNINNLLGVLTRTTGDDEWSRGHAFVVNNENVISHLNLIRYGKNDVLKEDAALLLKETERIYNEVLQDYLRYGKKYNLELERGGGGRGIQAERFDRETQKIKKNNQYGRD